MSSSEGINEQQRQLAELRSDVRHLQSDVTEIKTEIRAINQRIDTLRSELTARIDGVHKELTGKIDALKDSLHSAKVWALVLYIGFAAAMLLTMARGFKWI